MLLNNKKNYLNYQIKKVLKKNNLLFFINVLNKKTKQLVIENKKLKKFEFKKYNFNNKFLIKIFKISINKSIFNIIQNSIIFIYYENNKKTLLLNKCIDIFNNLLFFILTVKLNNKFYSINIIKKILSFNYYQNKKLIYKFFCYQLKKLISK
jgi:hypothetical protein